MNLKSIKNRIFRIFNSSLVRNTFWMLLGQVLRLFLQAFYFIIIARGLGAEQYGIFVGVTALTTIVGPFATWGSENLLVKNVSRNRGLFKEYWGNALLTALVSGCVVMVLLLFLAPVILPRTIAPLLIFLIALSDLFFYKILGIASKAFMAVGLLGRTAQIDVLLSVSRLMAALCLVNLFPKPGIVLWAGLYLVSTAIAGCVAFLLVLRSLGTPKLAVSRIKSEITEGFYFSVSQSSLTIYNDIDKTMLVKLATLEATGIYGAAYRLINVAFVPIASLMYAAYRKFFQEGASGISGSLNLAKRLLPLAGIYGIVAGIGVFLCAPIVPYVLGDQYAASVEALRWLSPLLFLKAMHYFAADTLTGAGFQGVRTTMQVFIALFNILANLWLIPLYSWKGAIWSSLASDGLLAIGLWILVFFFYRREVQSVNDYP